jgi:hypothetical protein
MSSSPDAIEVGGSTTIAFANARPLSLEGHGSTSAPLGYGMKHTRIAS